MDANLYNLLDITITALVGVAGILGVIYTAKMSTKASLSSTYLSEMITTYADFISAVSDFVNNRCELTYRDVLSKTLLRLQLFAPKELNIACQELYVHVLEWGRVPRDGALDVDLHLQEIQKLMISDIEMVTKTGHH